MKIRLASSPDWSAICEIYNSVRLRQFSWIDPATIEPDDIRRDSDGEEIHVAVKGGAILGFISVWSPESFIHHLFVSPDSQGQGVGVRLLEFACDAYQSPLRLKCVQMNEKALNFYKRNCWAVIDEGTSEDGSYLLMEYSKPNQAVVSTPFRVPRFTT
ncbi:MAG: GNAT family N-acetyltransferase [Verrucomicrobiales bacterium]